MFYIFLFLFSTLLSANSCLNCHQGIEPIKDPNSKMMKAIYRIAKKAGYPKNDCIVCHGGNPDAENKEQAHNGTVEYFTNHKGPKEFYPSPTSPWINKNTCGICHPQQVEAQYSSLMMSEAGKIQGALWGFGGLNGYKHNIGNYHHTENMDIHKKLGSEKYIKYMEELKKLEPQVFPKEMKDLPEAPTADEVEKNPQLAVYTYLRQECLRCHTGMKGDSRKSFGDYRGLGCASCHIPYSNSGIYEGEDKSIPKTPGHLLVHSLQSSRKTKVQIHDQNYSGIPVESCNSCHNRGKRIGVSYQGLMESGYNSPFDEEGNGQKKLHGKRYIHLQSDIHFKKGMLCQDCHTSSDVHGDGLNIGTNLGAVEIECQDCHGTTKKYPWELPLGYSDEFGRDLPQQGRGVTKDLKSYLKMGTVYEPKEGYLLSARGNPLTNVVREKNNSITVHLASGKDINLQPLKKLAQEGKLSQSGKVAMETIPEHMEKLECYTCHATWAPQCYGCHVKIDYSDGKQHVDWLKASHDHDIHGTTGDMRGDLRKYLIDGKISESRSYLRWENPALSQNGEGRISPTIPGCQTTITVIGKDGKALLKNHIFKIPNVEGGGKDGQIAIDMAPVQPHTIQKESRSCESCHTDPKAMGLGINGGKLYSDPSKSYVAEIFGTENPSTQIEAIPNLHMDWSKFIDENGTQLQTVGHHFKLSQPLNSEQLSKLDRRGVCLSCHKSIPEGDIAIDLMSHIAKYGNVEIDNKEHGEILEKSIKISAWIQIGVIAILAIGGFLWCWRFFKEKYKQ
ncbi:MAG TPA: cytochrome C [Campylobacterales bacterium]|nr:cytochrome C [Campylobacterales bacterium]